MKQDSKQPQDTDAAPNLKSAIDSFPWQDLFTDISPTAAKFLDISGFYRFIWKALVKGQHGNCLIWKLQQSWCTITQESNKSKQKPVIEIKTLFDQLIKILQHNCWIGYNTQIELDTADK